jgi:glycosyltransferase involved in cell wall biosynthesis
MRKKILVRGPLLSRSGYGEQARFALTCLLSRQDLLDIYLINLPWGQTGHTIEQGDQFRWIKAMMQRTHIYLEGGGTFDLSLQITIPNEFEKLAPVNIGYTAGIETNKVTPDWLQAVNTVMDRVIVISNHGKKGFETTKYDVQDQQGNPVPNWGLQVPVETVNYCVRNVEVEPSPVDITFETDKNFLVTSQWAPRKNLENTIRWFIDEFREEADVGLVLKTNVATDCVIDRKHTIDRIEALLATDPEKDKRKCKVYLIHGELSEGQLKWLYTHSTMKALINIAHGEGFGLPLFEAACNGLPLVTITWGGQMDFICKKNKKGKQVPKVSRVDYDIKPVQEHSVWPGVINADAMWAYARGPSYRRACRDILNKEKFFQKEAELLQKEILKRFTPEIIQKQFVDAVLGLDTIPREEPEVEETVLEF